MRSNGWGVFRAGALVVALLGFAPPAARSAPTNYELVTSAARQAAARLVDSLAAVAPAKPLALRSVGSHAGNFLVENALSGALTRAGHEVSTRIDPTGPVLEYEVVDLGIGYPRRHRHAWLGEERVAREARARLFARLVDQENSRVLWANQTEAKVQDEVRRSELAGLEEKSSADYLKATLPPKRWNKVVEPAVVTGIVVGLIVLFFSNQTSK